MLERRGRDARGGVARSWRTMDAVRLARLTFLRESEEGTKRLRLCLAVDRTVRVVFVRRTTVEPLSRVRLWRGLVVTTGAVRVVLRRTTVVREVRAGLDVALRTTGAAGLVRTERVTRVLGEATAFLRATGAGAREGRVLLRATGARDGRGALRATGAREARGALREARGAERVTLGRLAALPALRLTERLWPALAPREARPDDRRAWASPADNISIVMARINIFLAFMANSFPTRFEHLYYMLAGCLLRHAGRWFG